ncbi:hypothetical protein ABW636_04825 [Aquimarina sp. 2201CG1-2-11]
MWCRVTITYGAINWSKRYKRQYSAHDHGVSQQFNQDALARSLEYINNSLPQNYEGPTPVTQNLLGMSNQADQLSNDPGPGYSEI